MRTLLRREGGFGLIELLMAMTMLNIGLLAVIAAFSSGIISLNRASRVTTAAVLADGQMELYRALTYDAIRLDSNSIPLTAPYTTDTAFNGSQVTGACPGTPDECNASRQATGADRNAHVRAPGLDVRRLDGQLAAERRSLWRQALTTKAAEAGFARLRSFPRDPKENPEKVVMARAARRTFSG